MGGVECCATTQHASSTLSCAGAAFSFFTGELPSLAPILALLLAASAAAALVLARRLGGLRLLGRLGSGGYHGRLRDGGWGLDGRHSDSLGQGGLRGSGHGGGSLRGSRRRGHPLEHLGGGADALLQSFAAGLSLRLGAGDLQQTVRVLDVGEELVGGATGQITAACSKFRQTGVGWGRQRTSRRSVAYLAGRLGNWAGSLDGHTLVRGGGRAAPAGGLGGDFSQLGADHLGSSSVGRGRGGGVDLVGGGQQGRRIRRGAALICSQFGGRAFEHLKGRPMAGIRDRSSQTSSAQAMLRPAGSCGR